MLLVLRTNFLGGILCLHLLLLQLLETGKLRHTVRGLEVLVVYSVLGPACGSHGYRVALSDVDVVGDGSTWRSKVYQFKLFQRLLELGLLLGLSGFDRLVR